MIGLTCAALLAAPEQAAARPGGPDAVCAAFPAARVCDGDRPACTLCHGSASPPVDWNPFGLSVLGALAGRSFEEAATDALAAIETEDADGDGVSNGVELALGTWPGDAASVLPPSSGLPDEGARGAWDAAFALRRVRVAFCGISPTYEEMQALATASDPRASVHAALSECLSSDYWRDEGLPRLADTRVQPLGGAGACAAYYASFEFDYHLFVYAMTGDRDARDLLRAQYHVVRAPDRSLVVYEPPDPSDPRVPAPARRGSLRGCADRFGHPTRDASGAVTELSYSGGQPTQPHERAGMLTTQWFLWFHTMGSYMPRQTAAQAYRAWLGWDIARYEGLYPVQGEPYDVDLRGVSRPECATCHSTLDPLSYAFAEYWGGAGDPAMYLEAGIPPVFSGQYDPLRPTRRGPFPLYAPRWIEHRPVAAAMGARFEGSAERPALVEWAHHASDHPRFARNLAETLFTHAVGRPPDAADAAELTSCWHPFSDDGHSADRLLHRLIDTHAFGAP